jgi:hypothetical protein
MAITEPVEASFTLIGVDSDTWDVVISAEVAVLKAFQDIYNAHFIEKSVFDNKPVAIIPDFPNQLHAESWKEYWIVAFADPENACKTCHTVNELFAKIEAGRKSP